ncbi:MAG: hypothetical protein DMF56_05900 [Acidobacteria bacterium]|nr:MAG: hypothetical protein DMF56_05900 [Acidobacteriota bacterium]
MKTFAACALAVLLASGTALAKDGISLSLSSDDSRTQFGDRHDVRHARATIATRDRAVVLLLLDDVVAMQLSDKAMNELDAEKKKKDTSFLEDLIVAGVKLAVGKSIEYPIEHIHVLDYSNGALRVIGADNKPVFTELKVNGTDVLRDFSPADVARFASAFRAAKAARR